MLGTKTGLFTLSAADKDIRTADSDECRELTLAVMWALDAPGQLDYERRVWQLVWLFFLRPAPFHTCS